MHSVVAVLAIVACVLAVASAQFLAAPGLGYGYGHGLAAPAYGVRSFGGLYGGYGLRAGGLYGGYGGLRYF